MLAVADHMPWVTLGVLFGRIINIMIKSHGDVHMNAPSQACTYIPWQYSYSRGIVMVSLSNVVHFTILHTHYIHRFMH